MEVKIDSNEEVSVLFVEGEIERYTQYDRAKVKIDAKTKIYKENKPAFIKDLEKNMIVEIYTDSPVAESNPVQIKAHKIIILDKEKKTSKGIILSISKLEDKTSILVEGEELYANVVFDENTPIYLNGNKINPDMLKEGMIVEIEYKGEIALSYPAQMKADKITLLNDGNIAKINPLIRGEIKEINSEGNNIELLVEGKKEEDTHQYDKAKVTLSDHTQIYKNEEKGNIKNLTEGIRIEVYYSGAIDTSYPVQIGADKIVILD